jgi:hypothetical protein
MNVQKAYEAALKSLKNESPAVTSVCFEFVDMNGLTKFLTVHRSDKLEITNEIPVH